MPKRHFTFFDPITKSQILNVLSMAGIAEDRLERRYQFYDIRLRKGDLPKLKAAVHLSPDMKISMYAETSATSTHAEIEWEGGATGRWIDYDFSKLKGAT